MKGAQRTGQVLLILAGIFCVGWSVMRACFQSMTLDEADTYFWFVGNADVFYPYPNNHVLNSLLMWITTHAFGVSTLTARMPALFGAILYVVVCYFLCRNLTNRLSLQLPLFLCLTFNPFVMDFMVAARGYSLANAFLLAAIAIPLWHHAHSNFSLSRCCVLASLALGLSFTANFSFGFIDLTALGAILMWALWTRAAESWMRIAGLCLLPGLSLVLLICGYPLTHMKRVDLFYGAHSLGEMTRSLIDATLYQLSPRFGGSLFKLMRFLKPRMLPALAVLCACQVVAMWFDASWRHQWKAKYIAALGSIVPIAVILHLLAFRFESLPLPLSRTGIFLLPLCTLIAGSIAASSTRSVVTQWLTRAITGIFICLACYFLLCLRSNYFKEYAYDADVKDVYAVLARLNHEYGVTDVAASGVYASSLNFYRVASGKETFPEFQPVAGEFPVGKAIYVMHGPFEHAFIEREKLTIVYRGKSKEIVVAVSPGGPIPANEIRQAR